MITNITRPEITGYYAPKGGQLCLVHGKPKMQPILDDMVWCRKCWGNIHMSETPHPAHYKQAIEQAKHGFLIMAENLASHDSPHDFLMGVLSYERQPETINGIVDPIRKIAPMGKYYDRKFKETVNYYKGVYNLYMGDLYGIIMTHRLGQVWLYCTVDICSGVFWAKLPEINRKQAKDMLEMSTYMYGRTSWLS